MGVTDRKRALVTGASSGIGKHMARILASKGYHPVLVARNKTKLETIAGTISRDHAIPCEYFVCDLSQETELERLITAYPETDVLINNAGFAYYGFFNTSPWKTERDMIMVNTYAVARLCHYYLQGMMKRNYGRILNVASTAGLQTTPFLSTYAGTKAFVIQFSKSLALELQGYNVSVTAILPGPTATDFWEVAHLAAKVEKAFMSFDSPQEVAEFGIRLMEKNKISGIPGWKNKAKTFIKHFMPEAVWFYLIKRHMLHESLDRNT